MTDIQTIIKQAVAEGIEAGKLIADRSPDDAYKATEKRLRALPDIKEKIKKDKAYLRDILRHGLSEHSTDIIRFQRSGSRIPYDDLINAIVMDLKSKIASNEHEVKEINEALKPLKKDEFYAVIPLRYFCGESEESIAEKMHCDPSTVRRHRSRLVNRLAVRLYGVGAVSSKNG